MFSNQVSLRLIKAHFFMAVTVTAFQSMPSGTLMVVTVGRRWAESGTKNSRPRDVMPKMRNTKSKNPYTVED